MTLRGPDAHLSRTPGGWRRSGDGSNWARLRSAEEEEEDDVEVRPRASRSLRGPRPQSAIERGQRGGRPRQVENPQGGSYFGDPVQRGDRVPLYNALTTSMPALSREPTTRCQGQGLHSFHSRDFDSSSGSLVLSQWESSLGSQESLQASAAAERRGSWERARIMQAPGKEHTRLSNLTSVKIGWLPIKRRVVVDAGPGQGQHMNHYASQVKLKQPIAPTLQRAPVSSANCCRHLGGEVERSHSGPSVVQGSRTWQEQQQQAPCLASPAGEQVPEKLTSTRSEGDRLLGWQALKKGWAFNRAPPLCARSQPSGLLTGNGSDTNGGSPPINITTGTESLQPHALLQNATGVGPYRPHAPLRRSGAAQPVRPTIPLNRVEKSWQPSHVETSSAVTTHVPQTKAGFSSITISSRKITRSSSLPLDGHSAAGPNPDPLTMERKATIVKVMEHSVTSSRPPPSSTDEAESRLYNEPPRTPDAVVRRRKATIIKVTTEHRETYTDGGHPDYRQSYMEGLYREDSSVWRQRDLQGTSELDSSSTPSGRPLGSPERSWACETTDTSISDPESEGHTVHRSTLSLYVSGPPDVEAPPAPPELSPTAGGGEQWDRPHRPLSCYARVFRHTEPSREDNVAEPAMSRRLSLGLESNIDSAGSLAGGHGTSHEGTHHQPRGDGSVRGPAPLLQTPLNTSKRPSLSPPLTLIKSPDPDKQQTPQDILAANAAAIIANIKLQRRLNPVTSSSSSPQGNTAGCARNVGKPRSAQRPDKQRTSAVHLNPPHAGFVPLSPDPNRRPDTAVSLQEALEKSRPDFISRSQGRVRELEQKTQARRRREQAVSLEPCSDAILGHKAGRRHPPLRHHAAQTDNLLRDRDRAITGRETALRSQRFHNSLPEVKRKREAEKKRELYLTNRQRVELFKKKLLDQILQRTND